MVDCSCMLKRSVSNKLKVGYHLQLCTETASVGYHEARVHEDLKDKYKAISVYSCLRYPTFNLFKNLHFILTHSYNHAPSERILNFCNLLFLKLHITLYMFTYIVEHSCCKYELSNQ